MTCECNHCRREKTRAHTLWQYLEKEQLDPKDELTNKQWRGFVNEFDESFVEIVTELGQDFLAQWKNVRVLRP
jgi:hypothetical protein